VDPAQSTPQSFTALEQDVAWRGGGIDSNRDDRKDACSSATDSAFSIGADPLSSLPSEVCLQILRALECPSFVLRIGSTSRRWHALAADAQVWRGLFSRRWGEARTQAVAIRLAELGFFTPSQASGVAKLFRQSPFQSLKDREEASELSGSTTSQISTRLRSDKERLQSLRAQGCTWKTVYRERAHLSSNWTKARYSVRSFAGHSDAVYCVQLNGNLLASGSRDKSLKFWNVDTLHCNRILSGHDGSVLCMQHDGKRYIATGSSDCTAVIWDYATGTAKHILTGHALPVLDIGFDETRLVTCSKDFTLKVWTLATGKLLHTLKGHEAAVNALHMHDNRVVSASGDCTIKMWNLDTGKLMSTFVGHSRGLACIQFDGKHIVSGSNDFTIKVWEADSGICVMTLEGHSQLVRTVCFDDERIVSGSYDNTIKVWDRNTGALLYTLEGVHNSWIFHVQMDASRIVSSGQDRRVAIWDFGTGCLLAKEFSA
ncbi:hypothetical protein HDU84_007417, partial [Entophlyctis sp. JEL0112]